MAEKVLTFDPSDGDDRSYVNSLFAEGWASTMRLLLNRDDGLRVFLHLERCDHCHPPECEGYDEEDDEEYQDKKRRRMEEFERRYPKRPEDDNPPF